MADLQERSPAHLFVASRDGLLAIELDRGETQVQPWALYGTALDSLHTDAAGNLIAAGTRRAGARWTEDGGDTWQDCAGLDGGQVSGLTGDAKTLLAHLAPAALARSDDHGRTFRRLDELQGPWTTSWKPLGADEHPRLTAALLRGDRYIVAVAEGGVLVTESGGDGFRKVSEGLPPTPLALAAASTSDEDILAGTLTGLYRTNKLGSSVWRSVFTPRERKAVTAIAMNPANPAHIVFGASRALDLAKPGDPAGADALLYASQDGGQSFRVADLGMVRVARGRVTAIVFPPSDPGRIFVGTTAGELLESKDGGLTFQVIAASLPGVHDLVVGPALV